MLDEGEAMHPVLTVLVAGYRTRETISTKSFSAAQERPCKRG